MIACAGYRRYLFRRHVLRTNDVVKVAWSMLPYSQSNVWCTEQVWIFDVGKQASAVSTLCWHTISWQSFAGCVRCWTPSFPKIRSLISRLRRPAYSVHHTAGCSYSHAKHFLCAGDRRRCRWFYRFRFSNSSCFRSSFQLLLLARMHVILSVYLFVVTCIRVYTCP